MTITHWDGMLENATTFRSGSATNERLFLSARITSKPEVILNQKARWDILAC